MENKGTMNMDRQESNVKDRDTKNMDRQGSLIWMTGTQ